jgi:chemotaxis protein methyltransferase CheR
MARPSRWTICPIISRPWGTRGEAPYSIAILLSRFLDPAEWNVTILGTDINTRFLRKASEGVYSSWPFRDTPRWVKAGYFRRTPQGRLQVLPRIRRMVTFSRLNLAEDVYPALDTGTNGMDLIICRNVLMYFAADAARAVADRFHRSLVEGGWLIVSPTEASHALFQDFAPSHLPGAILAIGMWL